MRSRLAGLALILLTLGLAACSSAGKPAPAATRPATARLTGTCVTGTDDITARTFTNLLGGPPPASSGDQLAEAYQLTLTNRSSVTAEVTGFAVSFYAEGRKLSSDSETLAKPAYITPGSSLTLTETPWPAYSTGQPGNGPYALATGGQDTPVTCQLSRWLHRRDVIRES